MSPWFVLALITGYFGLLFLISWFTSRNADAGAFYQAGKKAPWLLVSYGMLGVAISGITFVSVPGEVGTSGFSYFQLVIGYAIGLALVALVLLPLYYRQNVVSIYAYLEGRFGPKTHKTGAAFFLLAHLLGASFRLYLMAFVLQLIVFDPLGIPFALTVLLTILLIWLYTYKGGIQTVLFTDVLQTTFLLLAAGLGIWSIAQALDLNTLEMVDRIWRGERSTMVYWRWDSPYNFFKLVITGILLTVVSNGLDQAIMQKHLACRSLGDAQKNIFTLAFILLFVNLLFLFLGGALLLYASEFHIELPAQTDQIYPELAVKHLGPVAAGSFIIGIAAAAYSSADSSLTGLTTAFCVDFLGFQRRREDDPAIRKRVHLGFSLLIFMVILLFRAINDQSVISAFIKVAGYAYGPLLGLFCFGLISRRKADDARIPFVCMLAPALVLLLDGKAEAWFGFPLGYETILINGLLTFGGIYYFSSRPNPKGLAA